MTGRFEAEILVTSLPGPAHVDDVLGGAGEMSAIRLYEDRGGIALGWPTS
jgi:hypothetical protein